MRLQEYIQSETMELLIQQNSFPFVSECSGSLFYLQTEPINENKMRNCRVMTFGINRKD
jgi:hypothetical protein